MRTIIALDGKRFGRLLVVGFGESRKDGAYWDCLCDCGKRLPVRGSNLRSGKNKSCGCILADKIESARERELKRPKGRAVIDMTGRQVGKLTVLSRVEGPQSIWLCKCECGRECLARGSALRSGDRKSCGCARAANAKLTWARRAERLKGDDAPSTLRGFIRASFGGNGLGKDHLTTANRLARCLARVPVVADLNAKVFDAFGKWLSAEGYSASSRENSLVRFRSIWRRAFAVGLASEPEAPDRRHSVRALRHTVDVGDGRDVQTLRQFYIHFYEPLRLRGKSEFGKKKYHIALDHLARFLGREPVFSDLTDMGMGEFFSSFVERGCAPATANAARNNILALWRLAARKRFVEEWPDVPRLTEPIRIPKAWIEADLAKLWAALADTPGRIEGVVAADWWLALHHVLWWTGERIGAVLQLTWADMDFETGWLIVPAQCRKFGLSDKATDLPTVAVEALRKIALPERNLIFPFGDRGKLYHRYSKILKRAGLATDRKSKFHRMRKSAASHFEAAGGNATELLGHSNRKVTRHYLDPRIAKPPQTKGFLFEPGGVR